jgi:ech hydrogenase subunit B
MNMVALRIALAVALGLIAAPLGVGLLTGIDRRVTARLQSRRGPPLVQPFYDVLKLLGKEPTVSNRAQIFSAWTYCLSAAASVVLFFLGADLLLVFFVQATGSVFLVVGAMSVPSPFSQIGAQRELIQVLAYEPLLILVFVGVYLATGTFGLSAIRAYPKPLLLDLPLLYVVLGFALTIKLRKSPFDFSTSHHGHQEIVKGVLTEYSGPFLALTEIAHWYETALVLGICTLFWAPSAWIAAVLVALTYAVQIVIDNVTARVTWRWMFRYAFTAGLVMTVANIAWLYAR